MTTATTTTTTTATVTAYPIVRYADATAALTWLRDAFGLRTIMEHPNDDGTLMHAELHLGNAVLMFGSARDGAPVGGYEVYLALDADAIDAHHATAVAAGARITRELDDTGYGSREYTALDSEGNAWSFGTYRPTAG